MNVLVCDIDNTVADQMKSLISLHDKTPDNIYLEKAYSLEEILNYEVLNYSIEGVKLFKNNNYKIIWLTARKKKFEEATRSWLKKNNFPIDELILVDKIANKIDVINQICPDIIIDDCHYNQHNLKPLLSTNFIKAIEKNHKLIIFNNNWDWIIKNFKMITK